MTAPRRAPRRGLLLTLTVLLCVGGTSPRAEARRAAPPAPAGAQVAVLFDGRLPTRPLLALVGRLGWQVVWSDTDAGLVRLAPRQALAVPVGRLLDLLGRLPVVRCAEPDLRLLLGVEDEGKQSEFLAFGDELGPCSMGAQPALDTIGRPAAPAKSASRGAWVAVLDGGMRRGHEALPDEALEQGYDAIDGDLDPFDRGNGVDDDGDGAVDEGVGHGLAVAALVHLVAPRARLVPVRVLDDEGAGRVSTVAAGIDWARRRGCRVMNLSFGSPVASRVVEEMLARAAREGVLIVASAGNEGLSEVDFPARSAHVLAVAGVDVLRRHDPRSNAGARVWCAAPDLDLVVPWHAREDAYARARGTSFATPLVAAGLALAIESGQADPKASLRALARPYVVPPPWGPSSAGVLYLEQVR